MTEAYLERLYLKGKDILTPRKGCSNESPFDIHTYVLSAENVELADFLHPWAAATVGVGRAYIPKSSKRLCSSTLLYLKGRLKWTHLFDSVSLRPPLCFLVTRAPAMSCARLSLLFYHEGTQKPVLP